MKTRSSPPCDLAELLRKDMLEIKNSGLFFSDFETKYKDKFPRDQVVKNRKTNLFQKYKTSFQDVIYELEKPKMERKMYLSEGTCKDNNVLLPPNGAIRSGSCRNGLSHFPDVIGEKLVSTLPPSLRVPRKKPKTRVEPPQKLRKIVVVPSSPKVHPPPCTPFLDFSTDDDDSCMKDFLVDNKFMHLSWFADKFSLDTFPLTEVSYKTLKRKCQLTFHSDKNGNADDYFAFDRSFKVFDSFFKAGKISDYGKKLERNEFTMGSFIVFYCTCLSINSRF